jgi:hypothetical protein
LLFLYLFILIGPLIGELTGALILFLRVELATGNLLKPSNPVNN